MYHHASQEISTGLFLAVTGEEVVLQGRELINVCRFEAWERQVNTSETGGLKSGIGVGCYLCPTRVYI